MSGDYRIVPIDGEPGCPEFQCVCTDGLWRCDACAPTPGPPIPIPRATNIFDFTPTPASCRPGALYAPCAPAGDFEPVECTGTDAAAMCSSYCLGASATCYDAGWGLGADGFAVRPRAASDLLVLSSDAPATGGLPPGCQTLDSWHCHAGNFVGGTWDCGPVPEGTGGEIRTGAYALTGIVAFGTSRFGIDGIRFKQTLYLTPTSALLINDNSAKYSYTESFTYSVQGNHISFVSTCASKSVQDRPWSLEATFSASATTFEIFSAVDGFRATYYRVKMPGGPDGGSDSPADAATSGPYVPTDGAAARVIKSSELSSFQACAGYDDCHVVWGQCNCYATNKLASEVDEGVVCAANNCERTVVAATCQWGSCAKVFDVPCAVNADCKLVTGACSYGADASTCVCGSVHVSTARVNWLVGSDGVCRVNGPSTGQTTAYCNAGFCDYTR
jgi:hypothetical protein